MAPPSPSGSIAINQGGGPFSYGQTLTFDTDVNHMQGGYPMVEVALFQDVGSLPPSPGDPPGPPDGEITLDLSGGDLVGLTLRHPDQPVSLPPGGSTDTDQAAKGWARLLRYGKQTVTELDRVEFDVEP